MADKLTFSQIGDLVRGALKKNAPANTYPWVCDMYADQVIYSTGYGDDSKMYRCTYVIDDEQAVTLGKAVQVKKTIDYENVTMGATIYASAGAGSGPVSKITEEHVTFRREDGQDLTVPFGEFYIDAEDAPDAGDEAFFGAEIEIVAFSGTEDGFDVKDATLFEFGTYADKNFAMTPAEYDELYPNGSTKRVNNNLEHIKTILADGEQNHLGGVISHRRDGNKVVGRVQIPTWLTAIAKKAKKPIKVSPEFRRSTKELVGLGLVLNPRVKTAAIAAFSELGPEGLNKNPGGDPAPEGEKKMPKTDVKGWLKALFSGGKIDKDVHDELVKLSDEVPPEEEKPKTEPPAPKAGEGNAQFAAVEAALLQQLGVAFADDMIRNQKKAFPVERDDLVAQFSQAARDDARDEDRACFSADGSLTEGPRVKRLKEGLAKRPAHGGSIEELGDMDVQILFSAKKGEDETGKMSDERRKQLLESGGSGAGKAAAAAITEKK